MTFDGKGGRGSQAVLEFEEQRRQMVMEQIFARGIRAERVLEAMQSVPRHEFVPREALAMAYADQPLPIGEKQTISQPYMVAAMTEAMELTGEENVLEVGAGSGYQAAILSLLARQVTSIEFHPELADEARERLARLGYTNVNVVAGDGTLGYPQAAPFDAVMVTAAAPGIPPPLVEQLAPGGRLLIPVGDANQQELLRVRKRPEGNTTESLHLCRFVPLVGRYGWRNPSR